MKLVYSVSPNCIGRTNFVSHCSVDRLFLTAFKLSRGSGSYGWCLTFPTGQGGGE